jgi:hypothetical protein
MSTIPNFYRVETTEEKAKALRKELRKKGYMQRPARGAYYGRGRNWTVHMKGVRSVHVVSRQPYPFHEEKSWYIEYHNFDMPELD